MSGHPSPDGAHGMGARRTRLVEDPRRASNCFCVGNRRRYAAKRRPTAVTRRAATGDARRLRESLKPRELRYRLLWGHRYGFVRAAIRNRAPIVPIASIGADGLFDLVGNAFTRGSRWLRRTGIPIPLTSKLLPIPHFVRMKFVIGEPIPPPGSMNGTEDVFVRRMRREVEGALHELLEHELAGHDGICID